MSNEVQERSFQFALKIVKFSNIMYKQSYMNRPIIQQLLKSGTSIGANIEEAEAAQSK
jgi:four helix bundle protein